MSRHLNKIRHLVQTLVLLLFLVPALLYGLTGALPLLPVFYGTISSSTIFESLVATDPYAMLQVIAASRSLPALPLLVGAATVLVLYGIIGGRAFCGWVCPVNLLMEMTDALARKCGRGADGEVVLDRHIKIVIAAGILVLSALVAFPVFELFSPVGAIIKGLALGTATGIWFLVAITIVELAIPGRIWCRSLCPLGGFYELLGRLGWVMVKAKDGCVSCNNCKRVCLADPQILDPLIKGESGSVTAGDCMLCGKCVCACPERVLRLGLSVPVGRRFLPKPLGGAD